MICPGCNRKFKTAPFWYGKNGKPDSVQCPRCGGFIEIDEDDDITDSDPADRYRIQQNGEANTGDPNP